MGACACTTCSATRDALDVAGAWQRETWLDSGRDHPDRVRVRAHHGVYDDEREQGQEFVVDVSRSASTSPRGIRRRLGDTVHYGEVAEAVVAAVERDPVDLIETLAERIADVALAYPAVDEVEVTVHKPEAPISVPFTDVAVTIVRGRA